MAMNRKKPMPMVLIQRRVGEEEEEHNGTWKLAYADFVTALMIFFLIMWIMKSVSETERQGLADYFNPVAVSQAQSGADGMLSGRAVDKDGSLTTPNAPGEHSVPVAAPPVIASVGDSDRHPAGQKDPSPNPGAGEAPEQPKLAPAVNRDARAELESMLDKAAQKANDSITLEQTERDLRRSLVGSPELGVLADSVLIERTAEGLRVQLTDQARVSMFAVGSARLNDAGRKLLRLVAQATAAAPNPLALTGHTDGLGYADSAKYGNWELSSDRANAARRELIAAGVPPERIIRVEGRADLDHLLSDAPTDPRNRRISITLLKQGGAG